VAIYRKAKGNRPHSNASLEETVPVFSFDPGKLAPVVVSLWSDSRRVLERDGNGKPTPNAVKDATDVINGAGFDLVRAVVISEEEHDNHYTMQEENEVVFVLPNKNRLKTPVATGHNLLDTAKLLMACTPNGI
jgi:hypothetical protein